LEPAHSGHPVELSKVSEVVTTPSAELLLALRNVQLGSGLASGTYTQSAKDARLGL